MAEKIVYPSIPDTASVLQTLGIDKTAVIAHTYFTENGITDSVAGGIWTKVGTPTLVKLEPSGMAIGATNLNATNGWTTTITNDVFDVTSDFIGALLFAPAQSEAAFQIIFTAATSDLVTSGWLLQFGGAGNTSISFVTANGTQHVMSTVNGPIPGRLNAAVFGRLSTTGQFLLLNNTIAPFAIPGTASAATGIRSAIGGLNPGGTWTSGAVSEVWVCAQPLGSMSSALAIAKLLSSHILGNIGMAN